MNNKKQRPNRSQVNMDYEDQDEELSSEPFSDDDDTRVVTGDANNPDYEADYECYMEMFNQPDHPFGDTPLTLEEFISINYKVPVNTGPKLSFVPSISGIRRPTSINGIISTALSAADPGTPEGKVARRFAATTKAFLSKHGGQEVLDVILPPEGFGGGRGSNMDGGSTHNRFNPNRLNYNVKPIEIRLNTGIIPNTYGKMFMDADATSAPLHLSSAKLRLNNISTTDKLQTFYDQALSVIFQNLAQRAVGFNVNASTDLNSTDLMYYFETMLYALQVYYFFTSVISYCDNPRNHNQGMLALRAMFSADELDSLAQLEMLLAGMPIPPNMDTLCFYLMQNYKESSLSGSAIIKMFPFNFDTTTDVNNKFGEIKSDRVTACLTSITSGNNRKVANLLMKVAPTWVTDEMFSSTSTPLHDPQFNTIWKNLPANCNLNDGTSARTPNVTSSSVPICYNSDTNNLDGAVYGLQAFYNTTTATWLPSIIDAYSIRSGYATTRGTSRISYVNGASGVGFYPSTTFSEWAFSRDETYTIHTNITAYQKFGTESALNVTVDSVRETAYKLFSWILSLDTIGVGVSRPGDTNRKAKRSAKPTKSKGKSKRFNKEEGEAD